MKIVKASDFVGVQLTIAVAGYGSDDTLINYEHLMIAE